MPNFVGFYCNGSKAAVSIECTNCYIDRCFSKKLSFWKNDVAVSDFMDSKCGKPWRCGIRRSMHFIIVFLARKDIE